MAKYIKPTLDTKFHVDFAWWNKKGQNLRSYLQGHICPDCQEYADNSSSDRFDWVNPETAEVFQIDMLWYIINKHCQDDPTFLDSRVPLTSAIFRTFILNNNLPLTPVEIYDRLHTKSPDVILRTIGGYRIYKGIKPYISSLG